MTDRVTGRRLRNAARTRENRFIILGSGSYDRPGGLSMRWQALRNAVSRHVPCTYRAVDCDRREQCLTTCQTTTGPASTNNIARVGNREVWYADRTYCEDNARHIANELLAAGVTTVVCSGLETHRYVAALAAMGRFTVVFDMHNVEAVLHREIQRVVEPDSAFGSYYTAEHVGLASAAERAAVTAADAVWVCSDEDRALVVDLYSCAPDRVRVVPNVVDIPKTAPPAAGCRHICFTGRMDWYPNYEAGWTLANEIAPLVYGRGHDVPVVIAGAMAREVLDHPGLPVGVHLLSDPARTDDVIANGIMAVPLTLGGGSRFKILEAFVNGAPVVSTRKGAEGLHVVPDLHYLVAETPADFADALEALVNDEALRTRLAGAGWALVREQYSIDALAGRLSDLGAHSEGG